MSDGAGTRRLVSHPGPVGPPRGSPRPAGRVLTCAARGRGARFSSSRVEADTRGRGSLQGLRPHRLEQPGAREADGARDGDCRRERITAPTLASRGAPRRRGLLPHRQAVRSAGQPRASVAVGGVAGEWRCVCGAHRLRTLRAAQLTTSARRARCAGCCHRRLRACRRRARAFVVGRIRVPGHVAPRPPALARCHGCSCPPPCARGSGGGVAASPHLMTSAEVQDGTRRVTRGPAAGRCRNGWLDPRPAASTRRT